MGIISKTHTGSRGIKWFIPIIMLTVVICAACYSISNMRNDDNNENSASENPTVLETIASSSGPVSGIVGATQNVFEKRVRIVAVGDIMLGRYVGQNIEQSKNGYEYAFSEVSHLLSRGDIVFGNLEAPITESDVSLDPKRKIIIKAEPESINALVSAGFNMLSLANNHMMDYYEKGLSDTMDILDEAGIAHSGAGMDIIEATSLKVVDKNGLKIGLLAFSDWVTYTYAGNPDLCYEAKDHSSGVAPTDPGLMFECIAEAADKVDVLIVSLHWGIEESFKIDPAQIETAHRMIDSGVDLVLGHHPHQCQGMEMYKGKLIAYSLGNFIFDNNDPENKETFIVEIEFDGDNVVSVSASPVYTAKKIHVIPQTGEDADNNLSREAGLCQALGARIEVTDGRLVFEPDIDGAEN